MAEQCEQPHCDEKVPSANLEISKPCLSYSSLSFSDVRKVAIVGILQFLLAMLLPCDFFGVRVGDPRSLPFKQNSE